MIIREFEGAVKRAGNKDVHIPVHVTLSYDAGTDPFAVQAIFSPDGEEDCVWHFSRELLAKGSYSVAPYGIGDVKFRHLPTHGMILICLRSPGGHADVALPFDEVRQFLADTAPAARVTDQECTALVDEFLKEVFEA